MSDQQYLLQQVNPLHSVNSEAQIQTSMILTNINREIIAIL